MELSDIFFMMSVCSILTMVTLLEIYVFVMWAVPNGMFITVMYLLVCLAVDAFIAAVTTLE